MIAWLLGSRVGRWAATIALALALGALALWAASRTGEARGRAQAQVDALSRTVEALRRMQQAGADAPRSGREVLDRLREGSA